MAKKIIAAGVAAAGVAGLALYLWLRRPPPPPKVETRMTVTEEPPSSVSPEQKFPFSGYLESVQGERLAGKTIELYIDGEKVVSATDAEGKWGWNIQLAEPGVTRTLYAAFPGDEEYIGCSRGW
ncbi:hypothetical protein ES703_00021 [subsurface metagenome]